MAAGAGLDLGSTQVRYAALDARKGDFRLRAYLSDQVAAGEQPAEAAAAVLGSQARKHRATRVGLTGSALMMRYLPVPPVEDWRLERLMEFEIQELESRSGAELASSYNLLPVPKELDDDDTMLLSLVREDLLEGWLEGLGGVPVQAFTPNAVALYNAYLALGDHEPSTTLVANLGAGTLDLALVRGTDLYFARSVTTSLEKRDATLARQLGVDEGRARGLIHKHLDLRAALGERLATDQERVTRPLLPLYESLPTLLSGVVTLCKAQCRLRELTLDRVLLTGGGARARGLAEFLHDRLRLPVSVWNPADMVDPGDLPEEDAGQLETDGPAAAVALGLALSAADQDLYAMEILTAAARRKRAFAERGVFNVLGWVAAAGFLALSFVVNRGLAEEAEQQRSRFLGSVRRIESADAETQELLAGLEREQALHADLVARFAVNRSAAEFLRMLEAELPGTLWVEGFSVRLENGEEWGLGDREVPVVQVTGASEENAPGISAQFASFAGALQSRVPGGGEAIQTVTQPTGDSLSWQIRAQLLRPAAEEQEDEGR